MLVLARENQAHAGAVNVEFLKGYIEAISLPEHSVDVVISNPVVNWSPHKDAVFAETFRILRPGGRMAIAGVVIRDPQPGASEMPASLRHDLALWSGCSLQVGEYRQKLYGAGFENLTIAEMHTYTLRDLGFSTSDGRDASLAVLVVSAFVRAHKPAYGSFPPQHRNGRGSCTAIAS
jgi:ubiquinone/menaquinone biosynthesis C-methylase UbiE